MHRQCSHEIAAIVPVADAVSIYIITARYHPNITSQGISGIPAAFGSIWTAAEKCTKPPVLNLTNASPASVLNSKFVYQKLVVARTLRPSGSSRAPPPLQVLFLNMAMFVSDSQPRIVARVRQNPTRLNVQQPSSLSAVANEPNELLKRRVAMSSSPVRSSYCIFQALGCTHLSSRSIISVIFFNARASVQWKCLSVPNPGRVLIHLSFPMLSGALHKKSNTTHGSGWMLQILSTTSDRAAS